LFLTHNVIIGFFVYNRKRCLWKGDSVGLNVPTSLNRDIDFTVNGKIDGEWGRGENCDKMIRW
jgi:hypothetical protein